jgi:voltage-gated potassium channel
VTRSHRQRIVGAVSRIVIVVGVLLAVYLSAPIDERPVGMVAVRLFVGLVVVVAVLFWQIRAVTRSAYPTMRAVEAVATCIPLLILIFASAYVTIADNVTDSFSEDLSRLDAVYFTVTVLATVGFGDISPRSEVARGLVTAQMLVDLVLVGLVAKVLVDAVRRRRDVLEGRSPR